MKKYFFVFILLIFIPIVTSCQFKMPILNEAKKKPIPYITKVEKSPLIVEYKNSTIDDDKLIITFQGSHQYDAPITTTDYEFFWPNYIFDDSNTPYEMSEFQVFPSLEGEKESDKTVFLQATVKPVPHDEVEALMIPLYITPSLFENGYPVYIEKKKTETLEIADLTIEHIEVDNNVLQFIFHDNHPEKNKRNISYTFKLMSDGHPVYPIFQNVIPHDEKIYVKLQFSHNIELPTQFNIQRTSVHLPEWRFSFTLPIQTEKK